MDFLQKAHTGRNQWYWYVFSLLIIFAATQIGSLPLVGYIFLKDPAAAMTGDIGALTSTNTGLALMLFSFVVGFFAVLLCVKYVHGKRATDIVTGRKRIDWGRIGFGAGVWAVLSAVVFAIPFLFGDTSGIVFQFEPSKFFTMLLIALLLFPFQTSFEELVFRGYLMQGSYLLFKNRWAAVILTGVLFGVLHGANPEVEAFGAWVALPQYILMGLLLGYVAVKDNGMELSLGIHAANNILAAVTFTSDASTLQTHALFRDLNPSASWLDTVYMLAAGLVFILAYNRRYGNAAIREQKQRER